MINLNNKKIIAFDLDGTLAESKQHLEPFMSEVICDLAKKKLVAIISGGSINQFKKQFLPYFFPTEGEEDIISSNLILLPTSGSQCYEYDKDKSDWILTDVEAMPELIKNKILLFMKSYISPSKWNLTPAIVGDNIIEDRITQISVSALGQNAPISLKKVWDPDQKKRQQMKIELERELPEVNIIIGGTTTLDILPKGFDKAKGLLRLLAKLAMTKDDMVFVGDSIFPGGNDYSPLEAGIECIKVSGPEETAEVVKGWM